jgi:hypothetical protein
VGKVSLDLTECRREDIRSVSTLEFPYMRRRRLLISIGLILGFIVLVLFGLAAMVKREPGYYTQAIMPEGSARESLSREAFAKYVAIETQLVQDDPVWKHTLTADQINAYFQQDYFDHGGDNNLPDGFSAPRVKFEDGKMRLGVRYGTGLFSTVLTLEIKLRLVSGQLNVLAMEIVSLQAGTLPLSTGTLLDYISQAARRENIDISWYRHDGHPVAIMRLQADLTRPTFQFDRIKIEAGSMTIAGRSTDPMAAPPPRVEKK